MSSNPSVSWTVSTKGAPWRPMPNQPLQRVSDVVSPYESVIVKVDELLQPIEGFGLCFNELGWTSLSLLSDSDRTAVLRELFAPGVGANLSLCRMPIGANDFSRDWYSYDETEGDFDLTHFSIDNDLETLVPFIRAAQVQNPDLKIWASPWSPPTWMKTNGHYAARPASTFLGEFDNGIRLDQEGAEGTDMFRLEEPYLRAYANYFGKFVDAYRDLGVMVDMVMPQNEFNSAQVFPSCTWTPAGLSQFLQVLGPTMSQRGVQVFLGTLERPDDRLVEETLRDPEVSGYVDGIGVQWDGKKAVSVLHRLFPDLRIYQTEQECGDGLNDWRYARYSWSLMKQFFQGGANAYTYWNASLIEGGVSRWGWKQNSLVVVNPEDHTYRLTPDYYVLKHLASNVKAGARFVDTWSIAGRDNQLVFANPDGSFTIVAQNDLDEPLRVSYLVGDQAVSVILPPDSFSTFVVQPS